MANYVAVAEAVRIAESKTSLLREVMKERSEKGAAKATEKREPLAPKSQQDVSA